MQNPAISINDGGSLMCRNCGLYHFCKDGEVTFSAQGPLGCPRRCRDYLFPQGIMGPKPPIRFPEIPTGPPIIRSSPPMPPQRSSGRFFCDGCNIPLQNTTYGQHFHCQECPNFDLCSNCVINYPHNNLHHFVDYFASSLKSGGTTKPVCGGWGENSR